MKTVFKKDTVKQWGPLAIWPFFHCSIEWLHWFKTQYIPWGIFKFFAITTDAWIALSYSLLVIALSWGVCLWWIKRKTRSKSISIKNGIKLMKCLAPFHLGFTSTFFVFFITSYRYRYKENYDHLLDVHPWMYKFSQFLYYDGFPLGWIVYALSIGAVFFFNFTNL